MKQSDAARNSLILAGYIGTYIISCTLAVFISSPELLIGLQVLLWLSFVAWRTIALGGLDAIDICFVIILTVFQNVVLGLLSPVLSPFSVKIMLSINLLLAVIWICVEWVSRPAVFLDRECFNTNLYVYAAVILIALYVLYFGFNGIATLASARNILSPILFFALGFLISWRASRSTALLNCILILGVIALALGLLEQFVFPDIWRLLNITELWQDKGLTNLGSTGIPNGWFSAERINGQSIRRMVSTFADPLNLGTYLFLVFVIAYMTRRKALAWMAAAGIFLTVSKGGLAGLLIFLTVFFFFRTPRFIFPFFLLLITGIAAAFFLYSARYATGSVFLHVMGAVNSITGIIDYPLGKGIGYVGTLAQQFVDLGDQGILESGIGMIIGQLGVPGLLLYILFFRFVYTRTSREKPTRVQIVALSLLGGIVFNIIFNEVALSPNSSAGYFFLLGQIAVPFACTSDSELPAYIYRASPPPAVSLSTS